MSSILPLLMFLLLFAVVAACFGEGMWSNAVRLVNVVTAALLATNFYEPVARALDNWDKSFTFLWDFLALWGLFAVFLLVFRELTDRISRVNVRFLKIADRIGSVVFSLLVGWVVVCFTLMSLHTAPLGRNFLWGGFTTDRDERMVMGLGPDRQWLGFTRNLSTASFGRSDESWEFNADDEFIPKYATRRKVIEDHIKAKDALRVN
jgi:uncharacterized membrane protein required for colicin V production